VKFSISTDFDEFVQVEDALSADEKRTLSFFQCRWRRTWSQCWWLQSNPHRSLGYGSLGKLLTFPAGHPLCPAAHSKDCVGSTNAHFQFFFGKKECQKFSSGQIRTW